MFYISFNIFISELEQFYFLGLLYNEFDRCNDWKYIQRKAFLHLSNLKNLPLQKEKIMLQKNVKKLVLNFFNLQFCYLSPKSVVFCGNWTVNMSFYICCHLEVEWYTNAILAQNKHQITFCFSSSNHTLNQIKKQIVTVIKWFNLYQLSKQNI